MPRELIALPEEHVYSVINKVIEQHKIKSLVFKKNLEPDKSFIALCELHHEQIPNCLIQAIANMYKVDAIGVELPIEFTAESELKPMPKVTLLTGNKNPEESEESEDERYDEGDEGDETELYIKTLEQLKTFISCPIIAIDAPERIRGFGSYIDEEMQDAVRNLFMAYIITHYAPGKILLTVNGGAHYFNLFAQLNVRDPNLRKVAVFYEVNTSARETTITPDKLDRNRCKIITPNEASLRVALQKDEFRKLLFDTIARCMQAPNSLLAGNQGLFKPNIEEATPSLKKSCISSSFTA